MAPCGGATTAIGAHRNRMRLPPDMSGVSGISAAEGATVMGQNRESIVIGTRGSALALWQAEWVAAELRQRHAGLEVRLERIIPPADAAPDIPIAQIGTKGLFTRTLEEALLDGRIDVAVHSLKDLASVSPPGLSLAAIPGREDPREALVW